MMKDGLDIVLTDLDRDLREQRSQVESDIEEAQSVSDRLDKVEERADQIANRLPDETLDKGDSNSEEDSGEEVSDDQRLPLFKTNGEQVEKSKSWDEIRREAEKRLLDQGVNVSDASVDDVLDNETSQRIDERYSGDFQLHADLDRYDVWAAVAAGTVAALVDFGSCWIEGEAGVYQHSKKPSGHLLEVVFPLEDGDVPGQMLLVNPAKAAQKISRSCPDSFYGIAVDLLQAISVGVPCPFPLRMID